MQLAFIYLGTMIGAGFASGRELWLFFACYGEKGLLAMAFAGLLFAVLGSGVVLLARKNRCADFQELLFLLFPRPLAIWIDKICLLFLLLSLSIMFSGFAHLGQDALQIPLPYGYLCFFLLVYLCLKSKEKGMQMTNTFLVPFMLFLMLFLAGNVMVSQTSALSAFPFTAASFGQAFWQAGLYVGYNFFSCFAVLVPLAKQSGSSAWWAGLGGLLLGFLGCIFVLALQIMPQASAYQMPFFYLAACISPFFACLYTLVLAAAILTTAVANAYALQSRFLPYANHDYAFLIPALAFPIVFLGDFSSLVGKIYPFFGCLGFILLFCAITLFLGKKRQHKK